MSCHLWNSVRSTLVQFQFHSKFHLPLWSLKKYRITYTFLNVGIRGAIRLLLFFPECCTLPENCLKVQMREFPIPFSNALSQKFYFHNIAIINPLDIILLLICRWQHWPVKTLLRNLQRIQN